MKKLILGLILIGSSVGFSQQRPTKLWDKTYGGTDSETPYKVIHTSNHQVFIGGISYSGIGADKTDDRKGVNGFIDFWVVKMDSLGNKLWAKTYGGRYTDMFRTAIETSDGGFLLGGYSESDISGDKTQTGNGGKDYWVIKIDKDGNKQWDATFGGTRDEDLNALLETPNGDFLLGGNSESRNTGDKTEDTRDPNGLRTDFWVVRISSTGTKIWDKTYGSDSHDQLKEIVPAHNGGYLLVGTTYSNAGGEKSEYLRGNYNLGAADYWAVRIRENGAKIWDKSYGGSDLEDVKAAIKTSKGYLLAGGSRSPLSFEKTDTCRGSFDSWLVHVDTLGGVIWDKTLGGDGEESVEDVVEQADGSFIFAASSGSGRTGDKTEDKMSWFDYWVVKLKANGTKVWDGTYGGDQGDYCFGMTLANDNGILVTGQSNSSISGNKSQATKGSTDFWTIKLRNNLLSATFNNDTLCLGSTATIQYVIKGLYNVGNQFTFQLSDQTGSFATPTTLHTLSLTGSGSFSGSVSTTIPSDLAFGNQYRLRVISSNPSDTLVSLPIVIKNCCDALTKPTAFNRTGELYNTTNCAGQTIVLESSLVPNATGYVWSGPNGFVSHSKDTTISNISTVNSGYYKVFATLGNCKSDADSVLVTVKQRPDRPSPTNDGPYTTGGMIQFHANTTAVGYEWTGPQSFGETSQNPMIHNATTSNAGTYYLKVSNGECWSELGNTIVTVDNISSVENIKNNTISIYPNPVKHGRKLNFNNVTSTSEIRIIDMNGKVVKKGALTNSELELSDLNKGMYLIKLTENGQTISEKLIIE
jgi:hypothetical protein